VQEHPIKERSGGSPFSYARKGGFLVCSGTIIDPGMEYLGRSARRYSIMSDRLMKAARNQSSLPPTEMLPQISGADEKIRRCSYEMRYLSPFQEVFDGSSRRIAGNPS
jgi:hypothetical protein